jgi:death-on-curing protein
VIFFEEVLELHKNSIRDFGGSHGVRDINLLKSAVERPFQSFENIDLYPSTFEKAAAIFQSLVKNHPFVDGNKRTAFLASFVLLYRSGLELTASNEDAYNFVMHVSASDIPFDDIVSWFRKNTKSLKNK